MLTSSSKKRSYGSLASQNTMNTEAWAPILPFLSDDERTHLQRIFGKLNKQRLKMIDDLVQQSQEFQSYMAFERQFSNGTQWERERVENALSITPYFRGEKAFNIIYFSLSAYITALCVHSYDEMTLRRALFPIVFTAQYYFYTAISATIAISRLFFFNREFSLATDCTLYLIHLFNLVHAVSIGNIYPAFLILPEIPLALAILINRPLKRHNLPYKKLIEEQNILHARCQSLCHGIYQHILQLEEKTDGALILLKRTSPPQPRNLSHVPLPLEIYEQFLKKNNYKACALTGSSDFLSIKEISILCTTAKFFNSAIQMHISVHTALNQSFERIKQSTDYQVCIIQHKNFVDRLADLQRNINTTRHIPGETVLPIVGTALGIYLAMLSTLNYVNVLADYQNDTVNRDAAAIYSVWAFICLASTFMPFIKACSLNERAVLIAIHFLGLLVGAGLFNSVSFASVIPAETLLSAILFGENPIKEFNRPYNALVTERKYLLNNRNTFFGNINRLSNDLDQKMALKRDEEATTRTTLAQEQKENVKQAIVNENDYVVSMLLRS